MGRGWGVGGQGSGKIVCYGLGLEAGGQAWFDAAACAGMAVIGRGCINVLYGDHPTHRVIGTDHDWL